MMILSSSLCYSDSIVIDLCGYQNVDYSFALFEKMSQSDPEDTEASTVRRYVLPLQVDDNVRLWCR